MPERYLLVPAEATDFMADAGAALGLQIVGEG